MNKVQDDFGEIVIPVLKEWHKGLENRKRDRSLLRKASSLEEVFYIPSYYRLKKMLASKGVVRVRDEQLALVAILVAQLKGYASSGKKTLAQAFAEEVTETRFNRVVMSESRADLYRPLMRVMRMIDLTKLTMEAIVSGPWFWGEGVRKKWAEEYYTKVLS